MNRILTTAFTLVAALLLVAPVASAHARAITVEAVGERCYLYTNDTAAPEFWVETNGVLDGGVEGGTPADHVTGASSHGSGLQRAAGPWGAADTKVDALEFVQRCFA